MPTFRDWAAAQTEEIQSVELQRTYLRNPLAPGPGVCAVCRSTAGAGYTVCFPCGQHRQAAQGLLADAVAPIAYAIKRTQHAHSLAVYKATPPSAQAKRSLSSLAVMFIAFHWECLTGAAGGPFTHLVTVPSTRSRPGPHPLESMVAERVGLPALRPIANPAHPAEDRGFRTDRFCCPAPFRRGAGSC